MFKVIFYLIVLLVLCPAKITLKIRVTSNIEDVKVFCLGEDNKVITQKEIELFNVTTENLKHGIRVEIGRAPDRVFLKEPTAYKSLYKRFKWPQVTRKVKINTIKVIDLTSEEATVINFDYTNNTSRIIESKIRNTAMVQNKVHSFWLNNGLPIEAILYDMDLNCNKITQKFEKKWGRDMMNIAMRFGSSKEGVTMIKPGQTVTNKLTANKTTIFIEIGFTLKLSGNVIADYDKLLGYYHFYAPNIEDVMRFAGITNEVKANELLKLTCFTDPKLEVFDKDTSKSVLIISPFKHFRSAKSENVLFNPYI